MNTSPRIGIVGIGAMGLAMARNLHRKGHALCVRDIDPAAVAAAAALGIEACDSPAVLAARCEVLIVVVVDAAQIDELLFGLGGVVHAAAAPRTLLRPAPRAEALSVLLCSTLAAHDTERIHAGLATHAIALVDASVR